MTRSGKQEDKPVDLPLSSPRRSRRLTDLFALARISLVALWLLAAPTLCRASAASDLLNKGIDYFNNDRLVGQSGGIFVTVTARYAATPEAATAQYYLGRYFHRVYQITRSRTGRADIAYLRRAKDALQEYIRRYARQDNYRWVSDARFERFLLYYQLDQRSDARGELAAIIDGKANDGRKDPVIEIDRFVWSAYGAKGGNAAFDAVGLAKTALAIIEQNPKLSYMDLVSELQRRAESVPARARLSRSVPDEAFPPYA